MLYKNYSLLSLFLSPDIDECAAAENNVCDDNAECLNSDGSYTCTCSAIHTLYVKLFTVPYILIKNKYIIVKNPLLFVGGFLIFNFSKYYICTNKIHNEL